MDRKRWNIIDTGTGADLDKVWAADLWCFGDCAGRLRPEVD